MLKLLLAIYMIALFPAFTNKKNELRGAWGQEKRLACREDTNFPLSPAGPGVSWRAAPVSLWRISSAL